MRIEKTRLYLGNIPFDTTTDEIVAHFAEHKIEATAVRIIIDYDSGKSRGFGFAEVPGKDIEQALKLSGGDFGGRKMIVSEARPRQ